MSNIDQIAFPPVWIINLTRSPQRKLFMDEQLDKLGMDFEFFPAVDGQELTLREFLCYSPLHSLWSEGRLMARNEIGCALTHAYIYQRIIDGGFEEVLVLEDDTIIDKDLLLVIKARRTFPKDWELINFRTDAKRIPLLYDEPVNGYKICKFQGLANRTAAYLINQKGAKKLLKHVFPIRYPADGLLARTHVTTLVSYGVDPQPITLAEFPSEIWGDSTEKWKQTYWKYIAKGVRRIKRLLRGIQQGSK